MPSAGGARETESDGVSMVPTLLGRSGQEPHEYLYWEFHERRFAQAARWGKWKAVRNNRGEAIEIYDLSKDLSEENNIARQNPEQVRKAEEIFARARTQSEFWPV